jgi:hypothetical protein
VDDILLELKQTRRSALFGLAPDASQDLEEKAERIVKASQIHLVGGDPYYGYTTVNGESFLVRERSPFRDRLKLRDLDEGEQLEYARVCGKVVAQCHARSDADTGIMEGEAERNILESVEIDLFVDDVVRFAKVAANRMTADYQLFCKDHALGAFRILHDK